MNNSDISETTSSGLSRRTITKTAVWSVPVVAAALAAPSAAASVGNASISLQGASADLLALGLLNGSGTVTSGVAITVPREIDLSNGPGVLDGPLTGIANITWASGVPLGLLGNSTSRGFGIISISGATVDSRTDTIREIADLGLVSASVHETSTSFALNAVDVASNDSLTLPITFGLTSRSGVTINVAMTFTVTVSIFSGATLVGTDARNIRVLLGAGVL